MLIPHHLNPPISGKGYPRIYSLSRVHGYRWQLQKKTPPFPGFLGKSSRDYGKSKIPLFLSKWELACGPRMHSSGGPGEKMRQVCYLYRDLNHPSTSHNLKSRSNLTQRCSLNHCMVRLWKELHNNRTIQHALHHKWRLTYSEWLDLWQCCSGTEFLAETASI